MNHWSMSAMQRNEAEFEIYDSVSQWGLWVMSKNFIKYFKNMIYWIKGIFVQLNLYEL